MAWFILEDEAHAEHFGQFETFEDALAQARRLAGFPWDGEVLRAPCRNWRICGRRFEIVEYRNDGEFRTPIVKIDGAGVHWLESTPREIR